MYTNICVTFLKFLIDFQAISDIPLFLRLENKTSRVNAREENKHFPNLKFLSQTEALSLRINVNVNVATVWPLSCS